MATSKDTQILQEGIQILNYSWQYVFLNDVAVLQSERTRDQLIGHNITDVFPEIASTPLFAVMRKCMEDRQPCRFENRFVTINGMSSWYDIRVQPCEEGISIFSVDITDRIAQESNLQKANGLYALLANINQKIVTVKNEVEFFRDCCTLALRFGDFNMAWIGMFDPELKSLKMVDQSGIPVEDLPLFYEAIKIPNEQLTYIVQSGKYYMSNNVQNEPAFKPWKHYAIRHSINSCIVLPIRKSGTIIGLFSLYSKEMYFSNEDIVLLEQLTTDISQALDIFEKLKNQHETQQLLFQQEQQYRHVLDNMLEGVQIHDFNWRYIYVNDALVNYSTYTKEDLIGHSLLDKYPGIEHTALFTVLSRCMTERISEKMETEFVFANGSKAHFELSIQPSPEGLFILSVDRTEQKQAERQREFDTRNLHALINNTNDLLWSIDINYHLITFNRPFDKVMTEILGTPLKKGDYILKEGGKEQLIRFADYYKKALSGEIFSVIEQNAAQPEFWSEISFYPIEAANGIIGTACHSRDISERIRSEHQLRQSEIFNRGILDALSEHIAVINKDGDIIKVNDSWRHFARDNGDLELKYTIEGSNYFTACTNSAIKGDKDAANIMMAIKKVLDGSRTSFYYEYPCHSDTEQRWFSMLVRKFESDETLVVISHQDITARKIVENELTLKNVSLEKTNYELDRFVYSVSHDLRAPLMSMLGIANLIEIESKEPDTLLHIGMIKNSITRLDNFIKNILNYSRNNRTEISCERIPINNTIREIVLLLSGPDEYDDIEFSVDVIEESPFYSDKHRFVTIMENLISNAIKYHKKEKRGRFIRVTGRSSENMLELAVEDNGSGIARMYHNKIFDMFFRIASSVSGSGIGLYIVSESVEKLGGTIEIVSNSGQGTKFTITLKNLKNGIID